MSETITNEMVCNSVCRIDYNMSRYHTFLELLFLKVTQKDMYHEVIFRKAV